MINPELIIAVLTGTATDNDRATLHIAALQALVAREQAESAYWRERAAHEHGTYERAVGDYERSLAIIANLSQELAEARALHQQQTANAARLAQIAVMETGNAARARAWAAQWKRAAKYQRAGRSLDQVGYSSGRYRLLDEIATRDDEIKRLTAELGMAQNELDAARNELVHLRSNQPVIAQVVRRLAVRPAEQPAPATSAAVSPERVDALHEEERVFLTFPESRQEPDGFDLPFTPDTPLRCRFCATTTTVRHILFTPETLARHEQRCYRNPDRIRPQSDRERPACRYCGTASGPAGKPFSGHGLEAHELVCPQNPAVQAGEPPRCPDCGATATQAGKPLSERNMFAHLGACRRATAEPTPAPEPPTGLRCRHCNTPVTTGGKPFRNSRHLHQHEAVCPKRPDVPEWIARNQAVAVAIPDTAPAPEPTPEPAALVHHAPEISAYVCACGRQYSSRTAWRQHALGPVAPACKQAYAAVIDQERAERTQQRQAEWAAIKQQIAQEAA